MPCGGRFTVWVGALFSKLACALQPGSSNVCLTAGLSCLQWLCVHQLQHGRRELHILYRLWCVLHPAFELACVAPVRSASAEGLCPAQAFCAQQTVIVIALVHRRVSASIPYLQMCQCRRWLQPLCWSATHLCKRRCVATLAVGPARSDMPHASPVRLACGTCSSCWPGRQHPLPATL